MASDQGLFRLKNIIRSLAAFSNMLRVRLGLTGARDLIITSQDSRSLSYGNPNLKGIYLKRLITKERSAEMRLSQKDDVVCCPIVLRLNQYVETEMNHNFLVQVVNQLGVNQYFAIISPVSPETCGKGRRAAEIIL